MTETIQLPSLLGLPPEIISHILRYLDALDIAAVSETCRQLSEHSCDDQVWQPLVNENLLQPIYEPKPCRSFRELYIAHHPHWFLLKHRIWFADTGPSGKLLISRYDRQRGCIEAHTVVAARGHHTLEFWEKDREVIIHSFNPRIALDFNQPVLRLDVDSPKTEDQPNNNPSDRFYASSSRYSKEVLMETFSEAGLFGSFLLCRALPDQAISRATKVWPPLRFPARARTRNDTQDGYRSTGHRPSALGDVSNYNFRLRKWVEYSGRRASPNLMSFTSPSGLSAMLGLGGPYFAQGLRSTLDDGSSIRVPEDVTTYATLPESCYTPTKEKPWQGIWCGDYSGHGCEFLVIVQPDKMDERPLPSGMDWLRQWFKGGRRGSSSSRSSYASAQEGFHDAQADLEHAADAEGPSSSSSAGAQSFAGGYTEAQYHKSVDSATDFDDVPTGRLEAIKLTGDLNIPRGEYTFIAPEIGHRGFLRVADETIFKGARVVRSAGHIAGRGFREDQYTPSQLIMISHDRLAQFWEGFGHISYYQRVDLEALMKYESPEPNS